VLAGSAGQCTTLKLLTKYEQSLHNAILLGLVRDTMMPIRGKTTLYKY
jgi:hypothetical protein